MRRVPDTATRIKISSDGKSVVTSDTEFVINPYEEYALEQGVQLKEKHGGEVTVLTIGPERAIAAELKTVEFDVLLFGKKGVDDDNQQVGPMVAELLGIPCVTQIVKLDITTGKAVAHREVEGGVIVVETSLPSAFTAEKDLTVPRYASLRELVAARKKPILVKDPQQFPGVLETVSVQYPPPRPPGRVLGKGVEAVPILVKVLHEEAKVI